jgi:hypothetical protein
MEEATRHGRDRGGAQSGSRGRKGARGKRRGRRRQVGPQCQRPQEKEKKRGRRGLLRGKGKWAGGPLGRKVRWGFFSFLSFSFQTLFNQNFKIQIQTKPFKLFTEFYKLFKLHTSNQKPCKAK